MLGLGLGVDKGGFVINPFSDATLAFSLRDLGLGATYVVRVRRDSDNAEQDFTANEITDGTLESFVGSGNGFVTIVYSKSNDYNMVQNTSTQQPKIVNNGVLIVDNNKPVIEYLNSYFTIPDTIHNTFDNNNFSIAFTFTTFDNTSVKLLFSDVSSIVFEERKIGTVFVSTDQKLVIGFGDDNTNKTIESNTTININQKYFVLLKYDGNNSYELKINKQSEDSYNFINAPTNSNSIFIGNDSRLTSSRYYNGYLDNIIFFNGQITNQEEDKLYNELM